MGGELMAHLTQRGLTLMEVLVSLVLLTLVAGGTMIGFMLAGRVSQESVTGSQSVAEATQTLEKFRNRVACRQAGETAADTWFGPAGATPCVSDAPIGAQPDVLEASSYSPFLDPTRDLSNSAKREYTVTPVDVDPANPGPEAYAVTVRVRGDEPQ